MGVNLEERPDLKFLDNLRPFKYTALIPSTTPHSSKTIGMDSPTLPTVVYHHLYEPLQ